MDRDRACQAAHLNPRRAERQTFGSDRRLPDRQSFDRVLRKPTLRIGSGVLRLAAAPSPTGQSRLGLIVAKRFLRRATLRNRAKRCIREAFRMNPDIPALDIVVRVAAPFSNSSDSSEIRRADAERLFGALRKRLSDDAR